jgi:hypothetical protein
MFHDSEVTTSRIRNTTLRPTRGTNPNPNTTVLVDADDGEETITFIRKYLHGCREIRTKTGDLTFQRGEFSIESGYWDDDRPDNCRDIQLRLR